MGHMATLDMDPDAWPVAPAVTRSTSVKTSGADQSTGIRATRLLVRDPTGHNGVEEES